jgi:hypothetical protein
LPVSRTEGDLYSIPKFGLDRADVEGFTDELQGFHEQFRDCFSRSEPRGSFFLYMVGQFSPLERKSIEPIALQVEDAKARAMQRFVSDVVWDETTMLKKYHVLVEEDMGDPGAVLIFEESGFPKKGGDSAAGHGHTIPTHRRKHGPSKEGIRARLTSGNLGGRKGRSACFSCT